MMESMKSQITLPEASGFSVQVSAFVFYLLAPESRNLTPKTLEFGISDAPLFQNSSQSSRHSRQGRE